jgi:hypothetical protein
MEETRAWRLILHREHALEEIGLAKRGRKLVRGFSAALYQFEMDLLSEREAWGSHGLSGESKAVK